MATLPASAAGEVRRIIRVPNGDGTDSPAQGYAYLYPNLRPGTPYRASSVEPQLAGKIRLEFDGSGQLEDPETGLWAKVLASDAPGATFPGMQWVLEYHLDNVLPTEQPPTQYFTVPANSFVNVDLIADTSSQPAVQTVYINAAPTIAAVTTTDTAVNNLLASATATRTSLDARYALKAASITHYATIAARPTAASAGADTYAYIANIPGAYFRSDGTNWTMFGVAHLADATASSTAIVSPAAGMLRKRADTVYTEEYYAASTAAEPDRPAGWYPVSGALPTMTGTFAAQSVANNAIPALTFTESHDPSSTFTTSGSTVTLPAIHGRWKLESFLGWASNSTGGRIHVITVDGTTLATNGVAGEASPAFNESWSSAEATLVLAGGNTIRVYGGQTSGVSLNVSGRFTATYLGPA